MSDYARWRSEFARALDERLYGIEYLDTLILSMRAQCWFSDSAALVTEIRDYPAGARAIHALVAAGDAGEIVDILTPRAEAWGRELGCILAVAESRPGWQRALRKRGYEPHQVTVRKDLGRL
ncbi:MAG: hypothetical protein ACT4OE_09855 [Sphingosinicella sp.]